MADGTEIEPSGAQGYYQRGMAHRSNGDYDRAIADYSRAIEIDPKFAQAFSDRGDAHAAKGTPIVLWPITTEQLKSIQGACSLFLVALVFTGPGDTMIAQSLTIAEQLR